jgi:prevent-host-death family protein
MKLSVSEARERFAEIVNRVGFGDERIIIERHGKPIAALVSATDLADLERMEDARDRDIARAAMAEPGEPVAWETVKAELATPDEEET